MSTQQPSLVFKSNHKAVKVLAGASVFVGLALAGGFLVLRETILLALSGLLLPVAVWMGVAAVVRKPPELAVEGDTVVYQGHRYALLLVEIGEKERRSQGNVSYLMFAFSGVDEQDKYRELEIVATVWPQFDLMHQVLTAAVMQAKRKQIADEARRKAGTSV